MLFGVVLGDTVLFSSSCKRARECVYMYDCALTKHQMAFGTGPSHAPTQ